MVWLSSFLKRLFKLRESSEDRSPKEEDTELVKPFLDHLEDLRWMLIKSVATLAITMTLSLIFTKEILAFIQAPLAAAKLSVKLKNFSPLDGVFVSFNLAFYAGIILAFPLILYFIAEFILPALTRQEKRYILPGLAVAFGLFLSGISFCYFWVLPNGLRFFYDYNVSLGWDPDWSVNYFYSFVTQFTLMFGLAFELPVVVIILVKLGLLSHEFMKRTRSYAVVLIAIIAGVLTPTPDALSLACLGIPMYLLYELCIWIALLIERKENAGDPVPEVEGLDPEPGSEPPPATSESKEDDGEPRP